MYIGVTGELAKLSSPSEVDSFISVLYQALHQERVKLQRFRPLSRWIVLYLYGSKLFVLVDIKFPSPLEVNRFISLKSLTMLEPLAFPSPLEVDRFISNVRTVY